MSESRQISSSIFDVDRDSTEVDIDKHFFKKQIEIIKQGQKRKVIFGQMEQEPRSIYQILAPYMKNAATVTGNFAVQAGSAAYKYLKQGILWIYDQFTNTVIPYTQQQIPKLIFVISKKNKQRQNIHSSEFCVLSIEEKDYAAMMQKQKNRHKGPIKYLMSLGQKDKHLQDEIRKNYQVSNSFPIDALGNQNDMQKQAFYIPTDTYEIIQEDVRQTYRNMSRSFQIIEQKQQQKQKLADNIQDIKKSDQQPEEIVPEKTIEQQCPELNEKTKRKAYIQNGVCLFIHEQSDPLYPILQERLIRDDAVQAGYFINPQKLQKRQSMASSSQSSSGEYPLQSNGNTLGPLMKMKHEQRQQQQYLQSNQINRQKREQKVTNKTINQQQYLVEKPQRPVAQENRKIVDNERKVRVEIMQEKDLDRNKGKYKEREVMLN